MSTRLAALVVGLLLAGSTAAAEAQAPKTAEQAPAPKGALRGRTQIPVQVPRMPDLVGRRLQSARQDSRVVDLKLQLIARPQPSRDYKPGFIVGHEPAPDAPVKPGTSVTVFVAVEPPTSGGGRSRVPPDEARMPNLIGQTFAAARQDSRVIDLKLRLIGRAQITTDRQPGVIIRHEPVPGSAVKAGTEVTAFVAVAEPQRPPTPEPRPRPPTPEPNRTPVGVRVPRVEGLDVRDGLALISKMNLGARPQAIDTDRAPAGTIVDQNPEAGTLVEPPFTVTVLVARRPPSPPPEVKPLPEVKPTPAVPTPAPPRLFPMPDSVGRSVPLAERDARVVELQLHLNQQIDMRARGLPNTIVGQSVPAGKDVSIGQAVTVFVASGVAVPRVVQQQADAAAERIVAVGLNPRRTEEVSDLTPGTVLRQVPDPGVLVSRGAAGGITVAVPRRVPIPNVVGRSKADAILELANLRLRASPADDEASLLPPDQVVSQVPAAGTEVVVGAAVRIAVATGVEVPNLSGLSADAAQRAVAERGLSFEDAGQETDAVAPGLVFQQQPASGTRVVRGSRVMAMVAVAVPILVPNVQGLPRQRAAAILEAAGLRVDPEPDATASGRLVERQAPAANTRVARLTTVALFVAAPPAPPPTPPPPDAATPAPAPVPGPVLTQPPAVQATPPPALPVVQGGGVTRPPAQSGGGAPGPVAVPATPILPSWLLSLIVAVVAIGVSTYKLWRPSSPPPAPPVQVATGATPPPTVDVRPERGDAALRLEVFGRSLISMDVRVRVGQEPAEQSLDVDAGELVVEERRLYE